MSKISLTVREAAEFLGVSTTTVYNKCRNGELKHFKVGAKILFNREALEAWTKGELTGKELMMK